MVDTVLGTKSIVIHPDDTEPLKFVFEEAIPSGATLSAPAISVSPSGELALGSAAVNTVTFRELPNGKGRTIAIGKAVQGTPSGQVADKDYEVTVTAKLSTGGFKIGVFNILCRSN